MEDVLDVGRVEELLSSAKDDAQIQLYICMGFAIIICVGLFFLLKYFRKKVGNLGKKHHDKLVNKIEKHKDKKSEKKENNDEKTQNKKQNNT